MGVNLYVVFIGRTRHSVNCRRGIFLNKPEVRSFFDQSTYTVTHVVVDLQSKACAVFVAFPTLVIAWLAISRNVDPSGLEIFIAVALMMLGICIMIGADCQRHFTLKYRKGLITGGLYRYSRNPDYFGEILIYASFIFIADHWLATALLGYWIVAIFMPRFFRKDHSISRHPGWTEYKATAGICVPWAWINGRAVVDLWKQPKDS